jgi:prefoldin alpha subunit
MSKQKNEDLQKKYLELQIIVQQIGQIQQQLINIQNQVLELNSLKDNLASIKDIKMNTESFAPLGFNIFLKTKLQNTEELLVNVGSNVFIIKTIEETNLLIDSQKKQIEVIIKELEEKLNELEHTGELLQSEILKEANK